MDPNANPLMATIMQPQNVAVVLGVATLMWRLQVAFPKFFARPLVVRIIPLLSMPLCIGLLWIPGLKAGVMVTGVGDRIMLGCILSWGLSWGYKAVRQGILKKDERIKPKSDLP